MYFRIFSVFFYFFFIQVFRKQKITYKATNIFNIYKFYKKNIIYAKNTPKNINTHFISKSLKKRKTFIKLAPLKLKNFLIYWFIILIEQKYENKNIDYTKFVKKIIRN